MLTLLTSLGSLVLFILTLPIKSVKFLKEAKKVTEKEKPKDNVLKRRDTALSRIRGKRNKESDEKKEVAKKAVKKTVKTAVLACISFLRSILMFISVFSSMMMLPMLVVLIIVLAVIGGISGSLSGSKGVKVTHVYDNKESSSELDKSSSSSGKYAVGNWSVNQSASTAQILALDTNGVWNYISEGKYATKEEARTDAKEHFDECKEFWESLYYTVEVPVWVWDDSAKQTIVSSTKKITCNRNLAIFWTDFFTDLYNCPEQYVMEDIQGPNWRWVAGKDGVAVSMHSYGIAFDINPATSHAGDSFKPMGLNSPPYSSPDRLPYDEWRHTVCTFTSSWLEVARQYNLSWGGTWQSRYDNMHFSMPGGDTDKEKTVYINQIGKYADGGG